MKIGIIVEVIKREMPFLSILRERLIEEGHNVEFIFFRNKCLHQIKKFKPEVLLINGLRSIDPFIDQIYYPKTRFNTKIVCYYSEQMGYQDKSLAGDYNNKLIYQNVDFHLCWGKQFAKELGDLGVDRNRIWVIGSMQYDISFFFNKSEQEQKNIIAKRYCIKQIDKPWIIIADNIVKKYQASDMYQIRRNKMTEMTIKLAKKNPDNALIFRTHPEISDDEQNMLVNAFKEYNNIYCINNEHLFYWSHICKNLVFWCSTSSIQALLDNKHVFSLKTDNDMKRYWFGETIPMYENIDLLIKDVSDDLDGNYKLPDTFKSKMDSFITNWYYRVDGLSFERFIYFLNVIKDIPSIPYKGEQYNKKTFFKHLYYEKRGNLGFLLRFKRNRKITNHMIENELVNYKIGKKECSFKILFDGFANFITNE